MRMIRPATPISTRLLPRLDAVPTLERRRARGGAASRSWAGRAASLTARAQARAVAPGRGAEALRRRGQPAQGAVRGGVRRAARRRSKPSGAGSEGAGIDLTMPGRRRWVGAEHPVTRVVDEIVGIFRELGFAVAVGPRGRDRVVQLPRAQLPGRSSGDGHARHAVPRRAAGRRRAGGPAAAPHPHLAGADPDPARVAAAGAGGDSRAWSTATTPFDASHAPAFSQIEGLAVDEGISFVDLKATLIHFAHRFFSPSDQGAVPAVVLPLHRALGRDGRRVPAVPRERLPRVQGHRAGWRSSAAAWCIRRCSRTAASIRSATPAGRSGWGRTGSRCCATACRTSGCCCGGDMRFLEAVDGRVAGGGEADARIPHRGSEASERPRRPSGSERHLPPLAPGSTPRRRCAVRALTMLGAPVDAVEPLHAEPGAVRRRPRARGRPASRSQGHQGPPHPWWTTAPASR